MTLSVIIVNYNVRHFLELCLSSVQAAIAQMDAEIIVIDNLSSDDSCAMVRERFPDVKLIENQENVGFAKANNQAVSIAQGEYICILNPDTVVGETVFEKLYAFANANPKTGAIGVRLLDGTGQFLPECKRNLPTPKVAFQKIFGSGDLYYARALKATENGPVSILVGAFMFMKKAVYGEVGGFDERYFMYGEDIDLSYTIEQAGYKNYYFGEEAVLHYKGESTSKDAIYRKRFYGAMRIFYDKHLKTNVFQNLAVRMGLFMAALSRKRVQQVSDHSPENYILISSDMILPEKIERTVEKPVNSKVVFNGVTSGTEVIFDTNCVSFSAAIEAIIAYGNKGVTYKIIPKNSTFAVGSNSSDGRGEVITW